MRSDNMEDEDGSAIDQGEESTVGVYIKAFCSGISELMSVYKDHLLSLEHEFMQDRTLTIAQLQLRLALYEQIFPALTSLLTVIQEK
jgi:hypothetical protein